MTEPLELRRRRAAYRAQHRGTKEMDWLLGRYADAHLSHLDGAPLEVFERLLAMPDPELQQWILAGQGYDMGEFQGLIGEIRAFHGIDKVKV